MTDQRPSDALTDQEVANALREDVHILANRIGADSKQFRIYSAADRLEALAARKGA
tara:strand:+ start:542 stop:709 length:168 start_codon:yes stop_codon:yes gene_type:complete